MVWITVIADHAEIFGILFWNQYIGVVILDFFFPSHVMVSTLLVIELRGAFKQCCTYMTIACFTDTVQNILFCFLHQRERWC